ncbi:Predicted arabinose efflux permease, MFS family [Mycobacterium sp. 283mftsu]|uniref:MFS transporter n=1 Tax=Mycolicibacterium mucogenicum TaxID=56689 RepID=UPI0008994A84|nr:MFS transporter [Mycolicibacterium mucogenicum DSM 44124]SEA27539.1 Predicted arabinose efflux permease, MFS family [Mycobacterium sp. 283mftsu]
MVTVLPKLAGRAPAAPPDRETGSRRAVPAFLLAYAFAAIMAGTTLPTPMYSLYAQQIHFSVLTTTVVYAVYAGGVLFALLAFGRWSDVIGRRPVLIAGVAAAIVSAGVFLDADTVPLLLVGRALSGLSAGLFTGAATAAIIEAAPSRWRSHSSAIATIANIGGLGVGPVLSGILVEYAPAPLHLTFVVHIAFALLAGLAVLVVPETSTRTGQLRFQPPSVPPRLRRVFAISAAAGFCGFAVMGLFTAVAPTFLTSLIGVTNHAVAGLIVASIYSASALAQIATARAAPQRAIMFGCAALVLGMLILALALQFSSVMALIAAALMCGAGQGISFSRGLAMVTAEALPEQRAGVSSTYFVVAYVAISIPVIGEGFAAHVWGLRTAGMCFAAAVAALACLCLLMSITESRRATH